LKAKTACCQDVGDLLDLSYTLNTAEYIVLLDKEEKHLYSVQASEKERFSH
jgi:hypothetical protein